MLEAVRDRVEVSGHDGSWTVTAGSFDDALGYARSRFDDPVVLSRRDRDRWWPRVSLEVTTDPGAAADAPPLSTLARPVVPAPRPPAEPPAVDPTDDRRSRGTMPSALEEIFEHQNA